MSRSFHINLSSLLKEVPKCNFYFYLKPELFAYQKVISELTHDMLLITASANDKFVDILMEYLPKQKSRSKEHEKVLKMLKGKYIFHHVHENPLLLASRSIYNWVLRPDSCTQLTLYQTKDENGMLLLNPPDETYIDIGFKPPFTIEFNERTLEVKRIHEQTLYVYNDLPCLGTMPSILRKNHEVICTAKPINDTLLNTEIMKGFYYDYKRQNEQKKLESENKMILQYKYNALSQGFDNWKNILKDTFRIQQIEIIENSTTQTKTIRPLN